MRLPSSRRHSAVVALLLAGCALAPPRTPETAPCRDYFAQLDQRIDQIGVRDAGSHRIAGYPYLRVDRFGASFGDELRNDAQFAAWLQRLKSLDLAARRAELRNLGLRDVDAELAKAGHCGDELARLELSNQTARIELRKRAQVPDDYSLTQRIFGFYPIAVPFLNLGINSFNEAVSLDYTRPLEALEHPGNLVRWDSPPAGEPPQAAAWLKSRDALGVPQLSERQWQALAAAHAPSWWVEQAGDYDHPGAPRITRDGPGLDTSQPVTYFQPAFTRFGGEVLAQLVFVVWFSERPSQKSLDSYAGKLDGLIWRVTLDAEGQPLLYDTIHPCGCYHYWYPAQALVRKPQGGWWQEPVLFPQEKLPESSRLAIRVQSATHYVRRVVERAQATSRITQTYELAPYSALLTLDSGDGRTRSLFGEDGIVAGTQRGERWWLWVSGVPNPGAMRESGRQATSFVGRSHFDDPGLLDQLFEAPRSSAP
jgi:hypothetical protein